MDVVPGEAVDLLDQEHVAGFRVGDQAEQFGTGAKRAASAPEGEK
jgi:hypothetical protein